MRPQLRGPSYCRGSWPLTGPNSDSSVHRRARSARWRIGLVHLGARTTRCVRSQLARRDRDEPAPGVDCCARPHPLACFLQPVRLGDQAYQVDEKVFVSCRAWADGPYEAIHERVVAEGEWTIDRIPFGHDIMNEAPDVTLELLLATAERRPFSLSS